MKLTQGMYSDPSCRTFDLMYGQQHTKSLLQSAGWFNGHGEKLGLGDLSLTDLDNVALDMPLEECFIALSEADSIWDMPKDLNRMTPGIQYVMDHAKWVASGLTATRYSLYKVVDYVTSGNIVLTTDAYKEVEEDKIPYTEITRDRLFQTLGFANGKFTFVPKTINTIVHKADYFGLDVHEFPNGIKWAVGSGIAACTAAEDKMKANLHDTNFDLLRNYVSLYFDDVAALKSMSDKYEKETSRILKLLLGSNLNSYVEDQLGQKGCGPVLANFDAMERNSNDIAGLPPDLYAFRID